MTTAIIGLATLPVSPVWMRHGRRFVRVLKRTTNSSRPSFSYGILAGLKELSTSEVHGLCLWSHFPAAFTKYRTSACRRPPPAAAAVRGLSKIRGRYDANICQIHLQCFTTEGFAYFLATSGNFDLPKYGKIVLRPIPWVYWQARRCYAGWRMTLFVFLVLFAVFSFFSLQIDFFFMYPSTVALTASSCIPVRPQPLRTWAGPQAGVSPPRQSPPCKYIIFQT